MVEVFPNHHYLKVFSPGWVRFPAEILCNAMDLQCRLPALLEPNWGRSPGSCSSYWVAFPLILLCSAWPLIPHLNPESSLVHSFCSLLWRWEDGRWFNYIIYGLQSIIPSLVSYTPHHFYSEWYLLIVSLSSGLWYKLAYFWVSPTAKQALVFVFVF